ncbi:MAG: 50S ribosomal protein L22 [Patescibacteria group bacterium]
MEIISTQKFARISPKKLGLVAFNVKKLSIEKALETLSLIEKRGAHFISKVIKSAVANAKERGLDLKDLSIKEICVLEGPRLKRGMPVSRGRFHPIIKRMSHIRVVLTTRKSEILNPKSEKDSNLRNSKLHKPVEIARKGGK